MGVKPLKNPWALKDGSLVHISSVDPIAYAADRKKPDFVYQHQCPRQSCSGVLHPRALRSEGKRAHFAHLNLDCDMTHETAIHQVAKAVIMERRYLWLPELPTSPNAPYPILHPRREMLGFRITPESFVLGRWRADIEITDHPGPFAIFEKEGEPVLLVEIVVTSPVSQKKIEAVQRAGMKMMAIKLDKEDAESSSLPEMILRTADRQWLAHPAWMDERIAEWNERDRKIEAERLAEEARVQDIIARIRSGHSPEWEARDSASIDRFVEDHALADFVGIEVPGSHWMAGDPRWWQATLLKRLYYDRIQIKRDPEIPAIPRGAQCLSEIQGFVIPFRENETDARLLESVGVSPKEWSTPEKVVDAYFKELAARRFGRRTKGVLKPAARHHAIGYRHREIDQHLLLLLEGDDSSGTSEERIFEWKSEASRIGSRRSLIIAGGRHYDILLHDAADQAKAARRRRLAPHYYDDEETSPSATTLIVAPAPPEDPLPRALSSVREGQEGASPRASGYSEIGDGKDALRQANRERLQAQRRPAQGRTTKVTRSAAGASSGRAQVDHELFASELQKGLVKLYSGNKANSPERTRQLASLFMNSFNPKLGCRPADFCISRSAVEQCLAVAAGK